MFVPAVVGSISWSASVVAATDLPIFSSRATNSSSVAVCASSRDEKICGLA